MASARMRVCRAGPIRWARPGTGSASISRSSRRTPSASSCACSTPRRTRETERIALPEYTDQVWHGYCRTAPGPALRLPRPRSLRADAGPPLQPAQAAARSLCRSARRRADAGTTRTSATGSATATRDLSFDRRDNAPRHAEVPGGRHRLHLGRRSPAAHRRGPTRSSTSCMCAASPSSTRTCPTAAARHLRRPRRSRR